MRVCWRIGCVRRRGDGARVGLAAGEGRARRGGAAAPRGHGRAALALAARARRRPAAGHAGARHGRRVRARRAAPLAPLGALLRAGGAARADGGAAPAPLRLPPPRQAHRTYLREGAGRQARSALLTSVSLQLAIECGDELRMRAWVWRAGAGGAGGGVVLEFRRSRGCGLEFKRRFVQLRAALQPLAAQPQPPLADLLAPLRPLTAEPMDQA